MRGRIAPRWVRLGVAASLAACFSLPASAADDLDRLVALFDSVVFGSEIPGVAPATRLRKWTGEVRYKIGGRGASAARPSIQHHAAILARLTGLAYREIGAQDRGENLVILVVPGAEMFKAGQQIEKDAATLKRIVEGAHCYFLSYSVEDRITYGAVIANAEIAPADLDRCLMEEMAEVLGLPNDDDAIKARYDSLGRSWSRHAPLAPAGALMVRTLYDREMAAGLPRADALLRARQVIERLLASP